MKIPEEEVAEINEIMEAEQKRIFMDACLKEQLPPLEACTRYGIPYEVMVARSMNDGEISACWHLVKEPEQNHAIQHNLNKRVQMGPGDLINAQVDFAFRLVEDARMHDMIIAFCKTMKPLGTIHQRREFERVFTSNFYRDALSIRMQASKLEIQTVAPPATTDDAKILREQLEHWEKRLAMVEEEHDTAREITFDAINGARPATAGGGQRSGEEAGADQDPRAEAASG